ncbi:MAG: oligosaccharide flippase family protein [Erysipelotrichaceae bacterium]|nr:oligosaccharide flippase family protein [Erysipelotrichaceae bacterium]MBR6957906.1 oligosaccharide flippase family protein [Erysipelotrichaceae bacterium]
MKTRQTSFAESTFLMYIALIVTRILGLIFNTPFYAMVGDEGFFLYTTAYNIYALFLDISTVGIPSAISMIISEYSSLGKTKSKEKAYKIGKYAIIGLSVFSFLSLQLFARSIGSFYLDGLDSIDTDIGINEVATAVRIVSMCILVVPYLGLRRGYLQGHKLFQISSNSQVIEQLVRITFVLGVAFLSLKVFGQTIAFTIYLSLVGTLLAAGAAFLFLEYNIRRNQGVMLQYSDDNEDVVATDRLLRKIVFYCVTISIVSISQSVYNIINTKLLLIGLKNVGYSTEAIFNITNNTTQLVPKICIIVISLSTAMTSSIAPFVADSYAKGDFREVKNRLMQVINIVLVVTAPLAVGIIMLAEPVHVLFYGYVGRFNYGAQILRLAIILNMLSSITMVFNTALQSMQRGKTVCQMVIISIVLNVVMDLPLIYLFNAISIPAYLGATMSSLIAETVLFRMQLVVLKDAVNFDASEAKKVIRKLVKPLAFMAVVVIILQIIVPYNLVGGRVGLFFHLLLYAAVGGIVYIFTAYKTGALELLIGTELGNKLLNLLRRGKK